MVAVTKENILDVIGILSQTGEYGLDTETEGLLEKHRLFSVIVSSEEDDYYFNFKEYVETTAPVLDKGTHFPLIQNILENPKSCFYLANAKFDMTMLSKEGLEILGSIWDVSVMGRLLFNDMPSIKSYSLDSLAREYLGEEKDPSVETYIDQNKLWDEETWYGEKLKHKRFQDVPYDIMSKYACRDGRLVLKIGKYQKKLFREIENNKNEIKISPLVANEMRLTKTLFSCQRKGIKIDRASVKLAITKDAESIRSLKEEFRTITGFEYHDGPKRLREVFKKLDLPIGKTESGNDSFNSDSLETVDHRVCRVIEDIRWLDKRSSTYYPSMLYYSNLEGIIHPDHIQHGAKTGRMSCREPNLTNIPTRGEGDYTPMRSHFVPRNHNACFASLDFKQQELRLMFDLAGEKKLIEAVNAGEDLHTVTAETVGCARDTAKTINFGLAYGMGLDELAKALKVSRNEAKEIKDTYFSRMPSTSRFIRNTIEKGRITLRAVNWFGRECRITEKWKAYTLPNALIQGGCADMVKIAMNKVENASKDIHSKGMLFSVHDELLLELLPEDFDFIYVVKEIMETSYTPINGMKFDVDINHSFISWADKDMISGGPCKQRTTIKQ